jgi:hypothetical protein
LQLAVESFKNLRLASGLQDCRIEGSSYTNATATYSTQQREAVKHMTIAEAKAHGEKFSAQLHEAKALLDEFEAHARKAKAQAEIDAINDLKIRRQEIEKKIQDLKTVGEDKVGADVKARIEGDILKFKAALDAFRAIHKKETAKK